MAILRAAAIYFALVFGAGFVLGPMRMFWLVPKIGVRAAELTEMPIMLCVIYFAARYVVRRSPTPPLATGLLALAILLAAEILLGVALTGRSVTQVLFDRDPVSGPAYFASLAVYAAMPWWLTRQAAGRIANPAP